MKKGKLLATTLFVGALILTPHAAQANEAYMPYGAPITIHIDGEYLPCDVAPMVKNNRTLMPMRAAGEVLGATVDWDPTQKTITLSKDSDVVKFVLNSNTYYVNGTAHHATLPHKSCKTAPSFLFVPSPKHSIPVSIGINTY